MTTIVLNTDGPPDPQYVLELAEGLAELVRALNHLTRDRAALVEPAEVHELVGYLATAAARLPQLLEQVGGRLAVMRETGEVRVTGGEYEGCPIPAVSATRVRLEVAAGAAVALHEALDDAAALTSHLAGAEGEVDLTARRAGPGLP